MVWLSRIIEDLSFASACSTLPLYTTPGDGDGEPDEMLYIVTAKTVHKAIVCSELERCSTFRGLPVVA